MDTVVVAGAPRSGTTWVEQILASGATVAQVHEPDNDLNDSFALVAKSGVGRFPVIAPGELPLRYKQLWAAALAGGQPLNTTTARIGQILLRTARRSSIDNTLEQKQDLFSRLYTNAFTTTARPRLRQTPGIQKVVAKTVHASFCLEALAHEWPEATILVVRRNPLNAVASWLELGWKPLRLWEDADIRQQWVDPYDIQPPNDDDPVLTQLAWDYCLLDDALTRSSNRNPSWHLTTHETICSNPVEEYRNIFNNVGLDFTSSIEEEIRAADTKGDGYQTNRVAAKQIHRWKSRLSVEQIEQITQAVDCFASFRIESLTL